MTTLHTIYNETNGICRICNREFNVILSHSYCVDCRRTLEAMNYKQQEVSEEEKQAQKEAMKHIMIIALN